MRANGDFPLEFREFKIKILETLYHDDFWFEGELFFGFIYSLSLGGEQLSEFAQETEAVSYLLLKFFMNYNFNLLFSSKMKWQFVK